MTEMTCTAAVTQGVVLDRIASWISTSGRSERAATSHG